MASSVVVEKMLTIRGCDCQITYSANGIIFSTRVSGPKWRGVVKNSGREGRDAQAKGRGQRVAADQVAGRESWAKNLDTPRLSPEGKIGR